MGRAGDLYRAGQLAAAIDAAVQAVKAEPADLSARWLLAELLIIGGEFDRADGQLDTVMSLDAGAAATVVPVRHLLRGETARRDFFDAKVRLIERANAMAPPHARPLDPSSS